MKKIVAGLVLLSFLNAMFFAVGQDTVSTETDNETAVMCLTKEQACIVLAALRCFGSRFVSKDMVTDEEGLSPVEQDLCTLHEQVCKLQQQIANFCQKHGGCHCIENIICKLPKKTN